MEHVDLIRPLWEKLREHDAGLPGYFSAEFRACNYWERKAALAVKSKAASIFVDLVSLAGSRKYIAYSISSLSPEKHGEIENMFVDEPYRRSGIGAELMRRVLTRLDGLGAVRKSVVILSGNDTARHFYSRFGFYARTDVLVQIAGPAPGAGISSGGSFERNAANP